MVVKAFCFLLHPNLEGEFNIYFQWHHEKVRTLISCLCLVRAPPSTSQGSTYMHSCKCHTTPHMQCSCVTSTAQGKEVGRGCPAFSRAGQGVVYDAPWPILPSRPALGTEGQHTAPALAHQLDMERTCIS